MNFLVYKPALAWPRCSGHDVHTYEMMKSWVANGVTVHLACARRVAEEAIRGLNLASVTDLSMAKPNAIPAANGMRGLAGRFARYWGVPPCNSAALSHIAQQIRADAVIAAGLDALPLLCEIRRAVRVWYPADEWLWHHLSLIRLTDLSTLKEIKPALVKGLYERTFRRFVDRVWVVSKLDRRAMRVVSGVRNVDILPNGVDTEYFAPSGDRPETPRSAIFWGRLDFDPNIQSLEWFCRHVWPKIAAMGGAPTFTIMGARPANPVLKMAAMPGVRILADVADLRPEIESAQLAILPLVSGAGIKNKLLEAAAMGKAVLCTPLAINGVCGNPPVRLASSPDEWVRQLSRLWENEGERRALGAAARSWVCSHHRWETSALAGIDSIRKSLAK